MNALALVIGNNDYKHTDSKLNNAVNDANAIADKLLQLGFVVYKHLDCDNGNFATEISKFNTDLVNYDIALLFFSGHGLQLDGQNYICSIETNFADKVSAKYTSIPLNEILADIDKAKPKVKIIILDACRNNPFPDNSRGAYSPGLAPVYAPKGSIIAFSTSPGETASDGDGVGGSHSYFTKAILDHIDDKNIAIEEFFKRVRTSVYTMSDKKQLSWEHTSLIGDFFFNSGQLIQAPDLPYSVDVIIDSTYIGNGTDVDQIIIGFKSHDWYDQRLAYDSFNHLTPAKIDNNRQFILGRNLLQTACGQEFNTLGYFNNLGECIVKWNIKGENHILNGILFEIYFNSQGKLREGLSFKSSQIDNVFALEEDERYSSSFEFINFQLQAFKDYVFYIPSSKPSTFVIEIILEHSEVHNSYYLKSLKHQEEELFELNALDEDNYHRYEFDDFKSQLNTKLCIPTNRLSYIFNYDEKIIKSIYAPWQYHLSHKI